MRSKVLEIGEHLIPEGSMAYDAVRVEITPAQNELIEIFHNPSRDTKEGLARYAFRGYGTDDLEVIVDESLYPHQDNTPGLFSIEELGVPDYDTRILGYVAEVAVGIREPRPGDMIAGL